MATPLDLEWMPNVPGTTKSGQKFLAMAFDQHTSKQFPSGRFMVCLEQPGSTYGHMTWIKFEDVYLDLTYLKAEGAMDVDARTGPECVMCGQPTPAEADRSD